MKLRFAAMLAVTGLATSFALQSSPHIEVGQPAPDFKGVGSNGKEVSLKSLTADGPAFLVFWKERCPHNQKASSLFNALHKAYGDKVKLIGFVNASDEKAKVWVERFGLGYPLLPDANKATIKAYQLRYSICAFQVGKDGRIEKVFPGYGKESMDSLNAAMAAASGLKVEVDLSGAPNKLTWG